MEEQSAFSQIPTKTDMAEMLSRLENAIKEEITTLSVDLGHVLARVEATEERTENQAQELSKIKEQVRLMQLDQRKILYKLEVQENQNRRQNLRIRAVPEERGEDLRKIMSKIFNPVLDKSMEEGLKIERIHRVRKPKNIAEDPA